MWEGVFCSGPLQVSMCQCLSQALSTSHFLFLHSALLPSKRCDGESQLPCLQLQPRSQLVPEVPMTTHICGNKNAPQPKPHPLATTVLLFSFLVALLKMR